MALFLRLSDMDYPSIDCICNNKDFNVRYSNYSFICGDSKIITKLLDSCKILPYEDVLKAMLGSLYYTVNLARIKSSINLFNDRDKEIIDSFKKFIVNSTRDAYNNIEQSISFKVEFPSFEFKYNNLTICLKDGDLKIGNKILKNACYMINNIDNIVALVCYLLYEKKEEINVLKLKESIPVNLVEACKEKLNNIKVVNTDDVLFVPATEDSMFSFLDTCSINDQSKIIDGLFGIEVEKVKTK